MTAVREWTAICDLADLLPGRGAAALLAGDAQVAIFRTMADDVFALSNMDPFSGAAVLSRGILGDLGGVAVVASPMHKQRFALRTGVCVDDPAVSVRTYPVRVDHGRVLVRAP